jgi:hypothetical protein
MHGLQLSQCSIIRKFFSFRDQNLAKKNAVDGVQPFSGCAPRLPIAALIRPLVNFEVEACARDIIIMKKPETDEKHEHSPGREDLCRYSCQPPARITA